MPPRRRNAPGGRASVPPPPKDAHLPGPWRQRGALGAWAGLMEDHVTAWLAEPPKKLDPIALSSFLDEAAFADREEGKRMIQHQSDLLAEKVTASDYATYVKKWKAFSVKEREDLFLDILAHSQETAEMQHSNSLSAILNVPEFSRAEMTRGDGSGFLRLVDALMTEGRIVDGKRQIFVRNAAWEKKFGFTIDDETVLPPSKAIRAYQEEMRLRRHSKLFEVCGAILRRLRDPKAIWSVQERFRTPAARPQERERGTVAVREGFLPKVNSFDPTVKCCAACYKTATQIKPRTFSNCSRCFKVGRIVPYCSAECQKNAWKGGWRHKESCGQLLQHATLIPTFSAEPTVAALNIHLLTILRLAEGFPEPPAVWWFVRPAVGSNPVRFNPLAVEEPAETADRDTQRMIEIRTSAIHERDDDSLGILLAFLLECPGAVWDRAARGPTNIHGGGNSAPEAFEMDDPYASTIRPEILRQQLKDAFQLNEERLLDLIKIGKAALSQEGREVERKVIERFVNLGQEQMMKRYMTQQGGKVGLQMGDWRYFPKGERMSLTPEQVEALSLDERTKMEDRELSELEGVEAQDLAELKRLDEVSSDSAEGWESAEEGSSEEGSDGETSSSID